jgi:hypothetical protein
VRGRSSVGHPRALMLRRQSRRPLPSASPSVRRSQVGYLRHASSRRVPGAGAAIEDCRGPGEAPEYWKGCIRVRHRRCRQSTDLGARGAVPPKPRRLRQRRGSRPAARNFVVGCKAPETLASEGPFKLRRGPRSNGGCWSSCRVA